MLSASDRLAILVQRVSHQSIHAAEGAEDLLLRPYEVSVVIDAGFMLLFMLSGVKPRQLLLLSGEK